MKAIVYEEYGAPAVLKCEELPQPAPSENEVLVKVRAASANPLDWHDVRGEPYMLRLGSGWRKPKTGRLGVDLAGVVEAVGKNVTQFQVGDDVFGAGRGAFAEYVCVREDRVVKKPANLSFEQAAAVTVAGITALQGLRDKGKFQRGQKVLINGAAGGVGTFAVQIAKAFGAEVIGVCSAKNMEMVRAIGADRVIDYAREDFTQSAQRYDLILDCVGNHSLAACRRVLQSRGAYVMIGGPSGRWIQPLPRILHLLFSSFFARQKLRFFVAAIKPEDLLVLQELMASGKVTPVIDRCYKLSEVQEAMRHLETGHVRGKVVITMEDQTSV